MYGLLRLMNDLPSNVSESSDHEFGSNAATHNVVLEVSSDEEEDDDDNADEEFWTPASEADEKFDDEMTNDENAENVSKVVRLDVDSEKKLYEYSMVLDHFYRPPTFNFSRVDKVAHLQQKCEEDKLVDIARQLYQSCTYTQLQPVMRDPECCLRCLVYIRESDDRLGKKRRRWEDFLEERFPGDGNTKVYIGHVFGKNSDYEAEVDTEPCLRPRRWRRGALNQQMRVEGSW